MGWFFHTLTPTLHTLPVSPWGLSHPWLTLLTWLRTCTQIKCNFIAERVFERIHELTKAQFVDKLMECLGDSRTKGPAGILFEQAAHYSIRKGLKLTMTSLQSLHSGMVGYCRYRMFPYLVFWLRRRRKAVIILYPFGWNWDPKSSIQIFLTFIWPQNQKVNLQSMLSLSLQNT